MAFSDFELDPDKFDNVFTADAVRSSAPITVARDKVSAEAADVTRESEILRATLAQQRTSRAEAERNLAGITAALKAERDTGFARVDAIRELGQRNSSLPGIVTSVLGLVDSDFNNDVLRTKLKTEQIKLQRNVQQQETARTQFTDAITSGERDIQSQGRTLAVEQAEQSAAQAELQTALARPGVDSALAAQVFSDNELPALTAMRDNPAKATPQVRELLTKFPGVLESIITAKQAKAASLNSAQTQARMQEALEIQQRSEVALSSVTTAEIANFRKNGANAAVVKRIQDRLPDAAKDDVVPLLEKQSRVVEKSQSAAANARVLLASNEGALANAERLRALDGMLTPQLSELRKQALANGGTVKFQGLDYNAADFTRQLTKNRANSTAAAELGAKTAAIVAQANTAMVIANEQLRRAATVNASGPINPANPREFLDPIAQADAAQLEENIKTGVRLGAPAAVQANTEALLARTKKAVDDIIATQPKDIQPALKQFTETGTVSSANAATVLLNSDIAANTFTLDFIPLARILGDAIADKQATVSGGVRRIGESSIKTGDGPLAIEFNNPKNVVAADVRQAVIENGLPGKLGSTLMRRKLIEVIAAADQRARATAIDPKAPTVFSDLTLGGELNAQFRDEKNAPSVARLFNFLAEQEIADRESGIIPQNMSYVDELVAGLREGQGAFVQSHAGQGVHEASLLRATSLGNVPAVLATAIDDVTRTALANRKVTSATLTRAIREATMVADAIDEMPNDIDVRAGPGQTNRNAAPEQLKVNDFSTFLRNIFTSPRPNGELPTLPPADLPQ